MADEITPGCEIAARLANDVNVERVGVAGWTASEFMPGTYETAADAFARLCDHLHETLNSDASDSTKLAAIREYIEAGDPWLVAMREAFAVRSELGSMSGYARGYRVGDYDKVVKPALAAFRAKLGETA